MRSDFMPGAAFPDFELPDHTDVPRRLSVLQGSDPMVLTLARGAFCPKDHQFHLSLLPFARQCAVGYTQLVTITTDTLMQLNEFKQGIGADWVFLHDEQRTVQKTLEIQEFTDPEHDPMIPHVFVLEPGLKIHRIYNGYWYWGRPTIGELHLDLRAVSEKIRPDWRIDTEEARRAWVGGEKSRFFPYGGSMEETIARANRALDQFAPATGSGSPKPPFPPAELVSPHAAS